MTDAFDPEDLTLLKATSRDLEGATERHKHPAPARKPRLRDMGFWFDPEATPHFDWMIEIDLSVITPIISGARRPQDTCPPAKATPRVDAALNRPYPVPQTQGVLPDGAVGIATITSDIKSIRQILT